MVESKVTIHEMEAVVIYVEVEMNLGILFQQGWECTIGIKVL